MESKKAKQEFRCHLLDAYFCLYSFAQAISFPNFPSIHTHLSFRRSSFIIQPLRDIYGGARYIMGNNTNMMSNLVNIFY